LSGFLGAIEAVDLLATPTVGIATPMLDQIEGKSPSEISELVANLSYCTRPINYLGLPAITVLCGLSMEALPVGIQLIEKPFAEAALFFVASAFERVRGPFLLCARCRRDALRNASTRKKTSVQ
jgi:aspartyl-tRNA(Asn)/glutamyl-tRNA(Gln) amidotransferase subunit A